ncbi:MAG: alpha-2-macroglobulin family protein, partial [Alphaproteobacteria bacterium]
SAGGEALAARIVGNELCVEGLGHGAGYQLTVRAGLQGEGAILRADQTLDVAIPDRPRRVAFASRGLILPRFDAAGRDGAGLPIETVNVDAVRLLLLRVDDQDVAEGLAQGVVENEMGYYEVGRVAAKLGRNVWSGEIEIDGERNVARRTAIPIHEIVPDLEPGVYLAILEDPEADYYEGWRTSSQWFVVSDIGLTALVGQDGLTVAAGSLASAATAPGVR